MNDTRDRLIELGLVSCISVAVAWLLAQGIMPPWYVIAGGIVALLPLTLIVAARVVSVPAVPQHTRIASPESELPAAVRSSIEARLHRLEQVGFRPIEPWLRGERETLYILLQHPETSDVAVVQTASSMQLIECSRLRSDGSWLVTTMSPVPLAWPPRPGDDDLRIFGTVDPKSIWTAHQVRVGRDRLVVRNPVVTDPLAFVQESARRELSSLIARGYLTYNRSDRVKATLTGALAIAARCVTPWAVWLWWRGRRQLRALEKEAAATGPYTAARQFQRS